MRGRERNAVAAAAGRVAAKPQVAANRRGRSQRELIAPISHRSVSPVRGGGRRIVHGRGFPAVSRAGGLGEMRSYGLPGARAGTRKPFAPDAAHSDIAIRVTARACPGLARAALLGSAWLGALAVVAPGAAHAVDGTWTGPGSEWTVGTNWSSTPTVPDNTATFTNNIGAPTSVTISNNAAINTIEFDAAAPAYSFTVQNGATFTIKAAPSTIPRSRRLSPSTPERP